MPSTPNAARMTGLNAARTSGAACARSASPGFGEPGLVNLVNACSRPPA